MSGFVELEPTRARSSVYMGDKVKISFGKINGMENLSIYFGKDIAIRAGIKTGDYLQLFENEANPFVWLLKKAIPGKGRKVSDIRKTKAGSEPLFRYQSRWSKPVPAGITHTIYVNNDLYDGGVRIFLPGSSPEDRML